MSHTETTQTQNQQKVSAKLSSPNPHPIEPINLDQDSFSNLLEHIRKNSNDLSNFGVNITKGYLLIGNTGVGKTTAIRELSTALPDKTFLRHHEIFELYRRFYVANPTSGHALDYRKDYEMVMDDLNEDNLLRVYGSEIPFVQHFIEDRYNTFIERKIKTHFTTNLSLDKIAATYGDRFVSRLYAMCNIIEIKGVDYRQLEQSAI